VRTLRITVIWIVRIGMPEMNWKEFNKIIDGASIYELFTRQMEWSKVTFGDHRDPTGCLKHLILEAKEAIEAWESGDLEAFRQEVSDLQILVFETVWRSEGTLSDHLNDVYKKQNKNKARVWPQYVPGEPCLHEKEDRSC